MALSGHHLKKEPRKEVERGLRSTFTEENKLRIQAGPRPGRGHIATAIGLAGIADSCQVQLDAVQRARGQCRVCVRQDPGNEQDLKRSLFPGLKSGHTS
jgi:hypothetical protein